MFLPPTVSRETSYGPDTRLLGRDCVRLSSLGALRPGQAAKNCSALVEFVSPSSNAWRCVFIANTRQRALAYPKCRFTYKNGCSTSTIVLPETEAPGTPDDGRSPRTDPVSTRALAADCGSSESSSRPEAGATAATLRTVSLIRVGTSGTTFVMVSLFSYYRSPLRFLLETRSALHG